MDLVLDASVALSWLFDRVAQKETTISQQALDFVEVHGALVPAIWFAEVSNVALLGERRRLCSVAESTRFLSDLIDLPITADSFELSASLSVATLARAHHLTAYDASYLELAIRSRRTLATFDRKLTEAARASGVSVFGDPPSTP